MKTPLLLLQFVCLLCFSTATIAQNVDCEPMTLTEFFDSYGGTSAFSTHSVEAVSTFIQAEEALEAGEYDQAKTLVDHLFSTYPKGSNIWWSVTNDPNGANIGAPHAYYGLRMMEDIIDYQLNASPGVAAKTAYMKVVLVGCSEGIQPTTQAELENGTGPFVTNTLDPSVRQDNYCFIRQSLDFFSQYVTAITKGKLKLEVDIIELPNLCLSVNVSSTPPYFASGGIGPVWDTLDDEVRDSTDWWWILYPSHVPEFPDFDDDSFITGGMGSDNKGGPAFIIDDKWIVRKPAHLGDGNYNDIERRIYLPQWLQHEFFHHLYRIYPDLALEVNGHDWFDINFWPSDFEGQFEADFYAESLHKRLQLDCVPLETKLITRVNDEFLEEVSTLSIEELLGPYSLEAIQNDWHEGEILKIGNTYFWKNTAGVQWEVTPNLAEGKLETGPDCPYPGQDFFVELYQTTEGNYVPGATALKFQGDIYKKRFNLLRAAVPFEIILGTFARVPTQSTAHTGMISKTAGEFHWENDAGDDWSLTTNANDECFNLNSDSPTPDEKFQLVLTENECGLYALGFEYLGYYYWKPKRDSSNASPNLTLPIADLELPENFGDHSIDLSQVFTDPEGDDLMLFASSSELGFLSTAVNSEELVLSGGALGEATIYVMALDANGGLATDEFTVRVLGPVSSGEVELGEETFTIFPNPAQDYISVLGKKSDYSVSLFSADQSFQKEFFISGDDTQINLRHLSAGLYFVKIVDLESGRLKIEKIIKY